jgi:hypothetical protein
MKFKPNIQGEEAFDIIGGINEVYMCMTRCCNEGDND